MKIAIVGFGNLGKAALKLLKKDNRFELFGIFSRREIEADVPVYKMQDLEKYKGKIDILLMCGGSERDLLFQSAFAAKNFNIIDTFDTHKNTLKHINAIDDICRESEHTAILCSGWDPGLFSTLRVLFGSLFDNVNCFYGKGISMGHTNAIKKVKGVLDAKQYTIANKKAVHSAKKGKEIIAPKHIRKCYVAVSGDKGKIANDIREIPNYFKGEKTVIKFVSEKALKKRHNSFAHKGEIVAFSKEHGEQFVADFKLKLSSNPLFTAKIMIAYAVALEKLIKNDCFGAFMPMEIPISLLLDLKREQIIKQFC